MEWYTWILAIGAIAIFTITALIFGSFLLTLVGGGAPHVAIDHTRLMQIIADLSLTEHDVVVDLGAGTGTFVRAVAPRCRQVIGYEINPLLAHWSRWRLRHVPNAQIVNQSLFHANLKGVTVIYTYLFPPLMPRVAHFLHEHAEPGTRVLSIGFPLPAWKSVSRRGNVYMYQVRGHGTSDKS
jgi:hypothetical protein